MDRYAPTDACLLASPAGVGMSSEFTINLFVFQCLAGGRCEPYL
jgi:hypothetical protein